MEKVRIAHFDRVENIKSIVEDAGFLHFHLFLQCVKKTSPSGLLKFRIVW